MEGWLLTLIDNLGMISDHKLLLPLDSVSYSFLILFFSNGDEVPSYSGKNMATSGYL